MSEKSATVAIIMGSDSDWPIMQDAARALDDCGIPYHVKVVSAHRTPEEMVEFAKRAEATGYHVIIAGAGGAAHLPGMVAALTTLPVIGVPVPLRHLDGIDSLLSMAQMPSGTPVATVGIGNGRNAGLLAARIIAIHDQQVRTQLQNMMDKSRRESLEKSEKLGAQKNQRTGF
jgi:5-(carboxyamino)imidazole ribonucleotide mutase